MGADLHSSVVNRYLQSWGRITFVQGASVFPQNTSYNPTGM
jgi:gluconate 2-dehydrogenase alpha chain